MEDDLKKKEWKKKQSIKINLIGCDTIVNSPSYELSNADTHSRCESCAACYAMVLENSLITDEKHVYLRLHIICIKGMNPFISGLVPL